MNVLNQFYFWVREASAKLGNIGKVWKILLLFSFFLRLTSSEMLEVQTQTAVEDFHLNKTVKSTTIHSISETNIAIINNTQNRKRPICICETIQSFLKQNWLVSLFKVL